MPNIYDNVTNRLLDALRGVLDKAIAADFCIGYFNLRGWSRLADLVENFEGTDESCCRILVGMHRPPEEQMREAQRAIRRETYLDGPTIARLKREVVQGFREQIEFGVPTEEAEATLRQLARQLRAKKVRIKLFLRYPLHAKLYLIQRNDPVTPLIGFVGSSNLTLAGLSEQGELNVDVTDQDAAQKLQRWFDERWNDKFSLDISDELAKLIEESWAREKLVEPYLVYLKMAYHLSEEARIGERQFKLPRDLQDVLLDFQIAAVQLAARLLYKRGGVLLGDVVGLGKTLMATAVAKIFQEDDGSNTLIICPPNLQPLWQWHVDKFGLAARVLSLGRVIDELPNLPRFRTLIIDESHNLRNREGKRYQAIREYIDWNEPRVILITATPYNKHLTDISNQIRLFVDEDEDLGIRPERFFQEWAINGYNEADFSARFQTSPRSLRAFEQSQFPEDWRDLMRLFLVRRTRHFIIRNYAQYDPEKGRHFVTLNGKPFYFPLRQPKTLKFALNETDPNDQYARLYREDVVEVIENLALPRYGLANYLVVNANQMATPDEKKILDNLNRAGRRLIGFCRTNLFKRLESCGYSFLLSVKRHILRNMVTLYALENGLPIPIGTQDVAMVDTAVSDKDADWTEDEFVSEANEHKLEIAEGLYGGELESYRVRAEEIYQTYRTQYANRFRWLHPKFFSPQLRQDLFNDAKSLLEILKKVGEWNPDRDAKLNDLYELLTRKHAKDKVIVFTQFADTADYLSKQLKARGVKDIEIVTSDSNDPTALARRFSPKSNGGLKRDETELRILVATDVLAEGQNLQDCHIVVNFDLPWAIIRLIQRAGRVDRIGQENDTILVYSFLPAEGVERIIRLRQRLFYRLQQNQEVIGTDETFFGEQAAEKLHDLYTEKAGVLDDDSDDEDVDLTSIALQVWNSAPKDLQEKAKTLPPIVYATRPHQPKVGDPTGVLVYLRFTRNGEKHDLLVRLDEQGNVIAQSLTAIFQAATCGPETPPLERLPNHHELVRKAVEYAVQEIQTLGGQLGTLRSIRRKVYERLKAYRERLRQHAVHPSSDLIAQLDKVLDVLYRFPLKESARDALSRQMKLGIPDDELLKMVWQLYEDERLCQITEIKEPTEPQILCSLGLKEG